MNQLSTRRDRFDDLFADFFRRFARPALLAEEGPGDIKIDLTENERDYQVRAEIPGARKEDIRVSVDGNYVSISAEVKKEKEEKDKGGRVLMKETYQGSCSRGFTLGSEVDEKGVVAKLEDGVLKLTLPKRSNGKVRTIEIQ